MHLIRKTGIVAAVGMTGCASIVPAPEPALRGLLDDRVYVARMPDTEESDIYLVTYAARVPPEVAWEAASGLPGWAVDSSVVRGVEVLSELTEGEGGPRSETTIEITWRDGMSALRCILKYGLRM